MMRKKRTLCRKVEEGSGRTVSPPQQANLESGQECGRHNNKDLQSHNKDENSLTCSGRPRWVMYIINTC